MVELDTEREPKRTRRELRPASEEQMAPIECLRAARANVVVDAIPGSGKSASILNLARACPEKTILQLTYNTKLAKEVEELVQAHGIDNLTVCTYHALYVKYYDQCCFTDLGIRKVIDSKRPPARPLLSPDILVLDEQQDCTFLLFEATVKYMMDNAKPFLLAVFGDQHQALFGFRGADNRFLKRAAELWESHPFLLTSQFESFQFRCSFRLTNQIAWFVNNALLGENRIAAARDGPRVSYVRRPAGKMVPTIVQQILSLIQKNGFAPDDVFVISDSIASSAKLKEIANQLVMHNVPVFAEFNERAEHSNDAVQRGKVVFTTIHASKGRQRPVVVVAKFDNSSNRDDAASCPPTQFVATTRASTFLYIFESAYSSTRPFTFLKMDHAEMAAAPAIKFSGEPYVPPLKPHPLRSQSMLQRFSPSSLVKFVSDETMNFINAILDQVIIEEELPDDGPPLDFCGTAPTADGGCEDVSDLNGVALPAMFYDELYRLHRSEEENDTYCTLKHEIAMRVTSLTPAARTFLAPKLDALAARLERAADYLHHADVLKALSEGMYFRLHQMSDYDWLDEEEVSRGKDRMAAVIGPDCDADTRFEKELILYSHSISNQMLMDRLKCVFARHGKEEWLDQCVFEARVDIISATTIWEIKCASQLTVDHMVQLCVYAWIWSALDRPQKMFRLYNAKTHHMLRLEATADQLDDVMFHLIYGRDRDPSRLTDAQFTDSALERMRRLTIDCPPADPHPEPKSASLFD